MEIGVITNPNSRKNKGRPDRARSLQRIVGQLGEVHETTSPEAIKPVLRDFLRRDVRYWVSDGGDGALHWMLRFGLEVLDEDEFRNATIPLALPTNGGTIDFVAKNVGIRGNAEAILEVLRAKLARGEHPEVVDVQSMLVDAIQVEDDGSESRFRTIGFAAAVGGIGQRFFAKYYEANDPRPSEIVRVVAKTVASYPVASSPLRHLPGMPETLRSYANEVFKPTHCRCTLDGRQLEHTRMTGIHVASMSINLGGVMSFFREADVPGQLHAIVGAPPPWQIIRNLPRMYAGRPLKGDMYDGAAKDLIVEALGDEELLAPVIDGENYRNIKKISFKLGPTFRIAKVDAKSSKLAN